MARPDFRPSVTASQLLHFITSNRAPRTISAAERVLLEVLSNKSGMITSSLRRAVRSPNSPHSVSRPTTPSIAAPFSSRSHQRRQSSSKPPVPPNDGPANVANPSVKTVGTPRAKDATGQKRSGAESRLSRRKVPRARSEHPADSKDEWAINLPSVPSTQHLDPKGSDLCTLDFISLTNTTCQMSSSHLSSPITDPSLLLPRFLCQRPKKLFNQYLHHESHPQSQNLALQKSSTPLRQSFKTSIATSHNLRASHKTRTSNKGNRTVPTSSQP